MICYSLLCSACHILNFLISVCFQRVQAEARQELAQTQQEGPQRQEEARLKKNTSKWDLLSEKVGRKSLQFVNNFQAGKLPDHLQTRRTLNTDKWMILQQVALRFN